MPKVYLNESDRLSARLSAWVYGNMKVQGFSQKQLAERLDMSQQLLSYKLKNRSFTFTEFAGLVKALKPDADEIMKLIGMEMPRSGGIH